MPVTIKDIARRAGVSHTTVSRALHGSSLISTDTTCRILQIAAELGYNPNAAARSLKTNRSQALGVIVSSIADPFFSEILQGIEEAAQADGYSVFMTASQRDPSRERSIVGALREHRVDGLIICSTSFSAEQSSQVSSYGIPMVVINNQAAEDYRYSIYHDDVDGSRRITRHLLGLGHRRLAYLGNSLSGRTTQDRLAGFCQELQAADVPIPDGFIYQVPGGEPEDGLTGVEHFLRLPERPTALVCYNDMMAVGVLQGLRLAGVAVPGGMSVTGFDNIVFSSYTYPPLTTFDQPKRYIGSEAARLVLDLLRAADAGEGAGQPGVRMLQGKLLVRQSTAAPGAQGV